MNKIIGQEKSKLQKQISKLLILIEIVASVNDKLHGRKCFYLTTPQHILVTVI